MTPDDPAAALLLSCAAPAIATATATTTTTTGTLALPPRQIDHHGISRPPLPHAYMSKIMASPVFQLGSSLYTQKYAASSRGASSPAQEGPHVGTFSKAPKAHS